MTTSVNGTALVLSSCFFFLYVTTVLGVLHNDMVYEMCFPEKHVEDFLRKEGRGIEFLGELKAREESSNWDYRAFDMKEIDDLTGAVYYASAACDKDLSKDECDGCLNMALKFLEENCGHRLGARVYLRNCRIRYEESDYIE